MQFSGNVLIIEKDPEKRQTLETIFSFLEIATQTGEVEDCLSYLDSSSEQIDACVLGEIDGKLTISKILSRYPRTAFIINDDNFIPSGKENANYIGRFGSAPAYDELMQLMHYCQSFRTMSRFSGQTTGKRGALIKRLVGRSDAICVVRRLIEKVAPTDARVLILGESGTGKEVIARAIHDLSERSKKPFVPVNCGAIPGELLESELFGHEKGAFTGAFNSREGRFELAEGGTLFLDEIGDMPFQMQVKLLRVLQEHTFNRVGSNKIIKANVRIIAATHQNLEKMAAENKFREDLYYRLNVFPIEMPPLRERLDDLPILIQELVNRHSKVHNASIRFTQRAMQTLMQNTWKGNVRELDNLIERLIIMHPNRVIDAHDLPPRYRGIPVNTDPMAEREALLDMFADNNDFSANINDLEINLDEPIYTNPAISAAQANAASATNQLQSQSAVNSAPNSTNVPVTNTLVKNSGASALNEYAPTSIAIPNTFEDNDTQVVDHEAAAKQNVLKKNEDLNIILNLDEIVQTFISQLPHDDINLKDMITEIEIAAIKRSLEQTNNVVAKAAETLKLRRTTLIEKMKKYGISAQSQ